MKKVLLINGSPNKEGNTAIALKEIAAQLALHGIESEIFWIGAGPMQGCIGCGSCGKAGGCVLAQDVNTCAEKLRGCAALVIGSPVYYAGPNGALCAFLDRLFYSHGRELDGKPGACAVVCRRGGASAAFDRLNKYFTISNMPVAPSQYWNSVHGAAPGEAAADAEGLQTMRTLADNLAWMIDALPAPPARQPHMRTNFIR
jgi:multimeric flavodoxin WrbA